MQHYRIAASAVAIACLLSASAAAAHDFFLLPESFVVPSAGSVNVQASVGSSFPKPENVVAADRIERLAVYGSGNPQLKIAGAGTQALNIVVTGAQSGSVVAVVTVKPRDVEYSEDRIPLILEEYRVNAEAAAAVERLPKPRTWKVLSRRFAKSIICIERCAPAAAAARPTGAELEFVIFGDGRDHVQLLKSGQPLANYPVDIVGADSKRQHLTTDADGRLHVPAEAKGSLMLFAAYLSPPATGEQFTLDLTSLTFARD